MSFRTLAPCSLHATTVTLRCIQNPVLQHEDDLHNVCLCAAKLLTVQFCNKDSTAIFSQLLTFATAAEHRSRHVNIGTFGTSYCAWTAQQR